MDPLNPSVEIELGGKTRELRLDFRALALAEAKTGKNFLSVRALNRMSVTDMTAVVWGALVHEDAQLSLEQVQSWVHYGNVASVMATVSEAVNACFPPADEEARNDGESPLDETPSQRSTRSRPSAGSTSD